MNGRSDFRSAAEQWLAGDPDPGARSELAAILERNDEVELAERFAHPLEFGTAGTRGILGAGPGRMNRAVVIRTTAGLAIHLGNEIAAARGRGVVIGHDARRMSREFAKDVAGVLAAAGFRAWLFPDVVATPLLAFSVVHLHAAAGVMITASHNPAAYNGYKLYWENGAQIIEPHDRAIERAIEAIGPTDAVERAEPRDAFASGALSLVPDEVREAYLDGMRALCLHPELRDPLRIVYTPLHGVGRDIFERALSVAGFGEPMVVPEQAAPDPSFPTTPFPNPEEPGVLDLALGLAERQGADLVIAHDPDADRLAIAVPHADGKFIPLTGNQIGVLLGYYLLTECKCSDGGVVISTIVSSPMLGRIARALGVAYEETLTGFKWMENRALALRCERGLRLVLAYEEALGYAVGELVCDKDGVSAGVLFAELAAFCRARGGGVLGYLQEIWRRYGFFASSQRSIAMPGKHGENRRVAAMATLRTAPPHELAGQRVIAVRDYSTRRRVATDGAVTSLEVPQASDVLAFELETGMRVVVRPSGTEPKIKLYFDYLEAPDVRESTEIVERRARQALQRLEEAMVEILATDV